MRKYSAIELLRIILLFFLVATHWSWYWDPSHFIDTHILNIISFVSVTAFALITGMFVFRKRSLVFRNISRLLFIIVISILIMLPMLLANKFDFNKNFASVFAGSRDIWYIYAIIPLYIGGPLLVNKMNKTKPLLLFFIATVFVAIGMVGEMQLIPGVSTFFFTGAGLLFCIPFLFGLGMYGFLLKKLLESKPNISIWYFVAGTIIFSASLVLSETLGGLKTGHNNPLLTMFAICLVSVCYKINWHSDKVNWVAKRLYFVYEFHWYWQILWMSLFPGFISEFPHLQLYVNWIVIFLFGSVMSMIITEIQIRVWNRYVDPQMLKAIAWTKSKLIKPKVSN